MAPNQGTPVCILPFEPTSVSHSFENVNSGFTNEVVNADMKCSNSPVHAKEATQELDFHITNKSGSIFKNKMEIKEIALSPKRFR